jgi:ABC-type transport system substrate-binding protein
MFQTVVTYIYCVTKTAWEASPDKMATTPVGTGLYELGEFVPGSSYTLHKRANYWLTDKSYLCDKNTAKVDTINFKLITDTSTIAVALENGEIDYSANIALADRANFTNEDASAKKGYFVQEAMNNAFVHLTFNCGPNSPTSDINLRRAISYAIDAAACAYAAQGAFGRPCFAATNPGLMDADTSMGNGNYFNFDVNKAKEYLAKSNYNGKPVRILVLPAGHIISTATLVQQYCAAAGINVELLRYEFALYQRAKLDETGTVFDIEILGMTASDDYVWRSLGELDVNNYKNGLNHNFIYDAKLQKLYDTVASPATNSKAAAKELLDYVEEQCYVYGIFYSPNIYIGRDRVSYIALGGATNDSLYNAFVVAP